MRSFSWDEVRSRRLARHYLIKPAPDTSVADVVSAVCGIQAQVMSAAELAIGARVAGVTQQSVREELWERRRLVKTWSLRGTLHLHPADELPLWTAARHACPDWREGRWHEAYSLEVVQAKAVLKAIGDALDGRCLTRDELADEVARHVGSWARERLASTWADLVGLGAEAGILCFGPSRGSKVTFVRADQWIGGWKEYEPENALAAIFRRYLTVYGPATHRDFAQWFGGSHLKADEIHRLVEVLAAELEEVIVEGKRAWLLAADASWEPPRESLRLLPQYDCYVIGSRFGREHIVPEAARARVFAYKNGRFEGATGLPLLLVDGRVAGMWERHKRGRRAEIRVEPFIPLTAPQQRQLEAEAVRIGDFLGMEAELALDVLA